MLGLLHMGTDKKLIRYVVVESLVAVWQSRMSNYIKLGIILKHQRNYSIMEQQHWDFVHFRSINLHNLGSRVNSPFSATAHSVAEWLHTSLPKTYYCPASCSFLLFHFVVKFSTVNRLVTYFLCDIFWFVQWRYHCLTEHRKFILILHNYS